MLRSLTCWLVLAAVARGDGPAETVVRLAVTPKAAPRPALKYVLLPEVADGHGGNAVESYYKATARDYVAPFRDKQTAEKLDAWAAGTLDDLPAAEADRLTRGPVFRLLDAAARSEACDWRMTDELKRDGVWTLLPDIQGMREFANYLSLRTRVRLKQADFADAALSLQTHFALARHLGTHPTLIGDLVGLAVAHIASGRIDEWVGRPDAPNLYWGLTQLPPSFIDLAKAVSAERATVAGELKDVLDTERPLPAADWPKKLVHYERVLELGRAGRGNFADGVGKRAADPAFVAEARKRLLAAGRTPDELGRLAAVHVVLLDAYAVYESGRDDIMKWCLLPYHQGAAGLRRAERAFADSTFGELMPWVARVYQSKTRLDQRLGLLRCVEALRLYAAANGGKWPKTLADAGVPLPDDPVTGKPFPYEVKDGVAVVRGTPPEGREAVAAFNVR